MDTDRILTLIALGTVLVGALLPGVALDLVAVLAVAILVIGGVLTTAEAASGFGSATLLTVACMFILAEALQQTGAVQELNRLARRAGKRGLRTLLLAVLPVVMILSGFMNNTGVVVLLLPIFLAVSATTSTSSSRLLIPLSYAAILGGTLSLVGTTTNLLVDGLVDTFAEQTLADGLPLPRGLEGLDLLDFLPMGLVFCAVGLPYLVFVAPRLLPDRVGLATLVPQRNRSDYVTEVFLGHDAALVGRTLADVPDLTKKVRFLELVRDEETIWPPFDDLTLKAGDMLVGKGPPDAIVRLIEQPGLEGPHDPESGGRITTVSLGLAEVMVAPGSRLDGTTVRQARLQTRFGIVVLGVLRQGAHLREHLGSLHLRVGDTLLVQGEEASLQHLRGVRDDLILLGGPVPRAPGRKRRALAIAVGASALGLAATGVLTLPVAVLLGSVVLVAGGCLSSGHAYRSINLRILVILGCMLGVGDAVHRTGIANDVADVIVQVGRDLGPTGVLSAVFLTTLVLTELVTNAGTAAVMLPIAIAAAQEAAPGGVSCKPFVMAVALAASCSFLTPIGYQTNLLVYGPGGYRFHDYARVGLPLTITLWIIATFLLPIVFPF